MALDDTVNSVAGIIPLALVSGIALNMTNSIGNNTNRNRRTVGKRKNYKNGYTRERELFGKKVPSPLW